jgi:hypothetical protein
MTKTRRLLSLSSILMALILAPVAASAAPQAGSNELRLESSYLIPGVSLSASGVNRLSNSGSSGSTTLFGAGFAYGRFLTDNVELGSSLAIMHLNFDYGTGSSGSSQTGLGISPFLRVISMVSERVGLYGSATAGYQLMSPSSGSNRHYLIVGGDMGAEFFVGDAWSLRIAPTYRYVHQTGSNSSSNTGGHAFGLNWALAGYF